MTDDGKKAAIEAKYQPVLKELLAKRDPLATLAAVFVAGDMYSAMGGRAEVEAIEKVTTVTPPPRPATAIEKANPVSVSRVATPLILLPDGSLTSACATTAVTTAGKQTVIGQELESHVPLTVWHREREGGFYILGQPRTGKSTLLVNMALSDIENDLGILFIDPHTDAINDLLSRIPNRRLKDVMLLDPTVKQHSFGLNLLHCKDHKDGIELDHTVGRVLDIFTKVWGDQQTGRLGIWLEKIVANSVYLLLENPGHTLLDIPPLLWENTTFRNRLLKEVEIKSSVVDFWRNEFDQLTKRDRTLEVEPARTRLYIFRRNDMIKDIVGQKTSTIDFAQILRENKIVLLRMPVNLSSEVKHLIGTMRLSELLYAVFERSEQRETDRPYFGIYCDEFQEFATPDFARLFTQGGKFKVMPTVAHQTRVGQFRMEDPNRGATLASRGKAFFTLSSPDAKEVPLELAKAPSETGVVSQYPVRDLLEGHDNPKIREFVNKYIRVLEDKREDIRAEMEGTKFERMVELDTAAIYGAAAQEEGIAGPSHYSGQLAAVSARQGALVIARMLSIKLVELQKYGNRLRLTMRELDRFLVEIMEGNKRAEQEAFADFMINLAHTTSTVSARYAKVLDLYIAVSYGDPGKPRTIPFDLARSQGLFSKEVRALTFQAAKKTEEERRAFRAGFIPREEKERAYWRRSARDQKSGDRLRAMEERIQWMRRRCSDIRGGRTGTRGYNINREEDRIWYPANVYTWYMWLHVFPDIEKLVIPYRSAKFTEVWKYLMDEGQAAKTIVGLYESLKLVEYPGYGCRRYMPYMRAGVAWDIKNFLHRYQEGALVMLALLDCAGKGGWRVMSSRSDDISLSELPGIKGQDPVEVWCLVEKIRALMRGALGEETLSSLFIDYLDGYGYGDTYDGLDEKLYNAGFQTRVGRYPLYDDISYRKDVQSLEALVSERWSWFVSHHSVAGLWWAKSAAPIRYYLLCCAADRISFGEKYSSLPPSAFAPYEDVVGALVSLSRDTLARIEEAEEKEAAARERERIEKECAEKVGEISVDPPALLKSRVLSGSEMQEVRIACVRELSQDTNTFRVAATIDEFVEFCKLLAQPENHIKGRYAKTRTEADMVNEMARVLTDLQDYTAYAKVRREQAGESIAWKGKIRTMKLSSVPADALEEAYAVVEQNASAYTRPRAEIRREIEERQAPWRQPVRFEAPAVRSAEKKARAPVERVSGPEEPMPPSHYESKP